MSQWHSRKLQDLIQSSGVNPETGLANQEAAQRLVYYGRNRLVEETHIRFLAILREEITEPIARAKVRGTKIRCPKWLINRPFNP